MGEDDVEKGILWVLLLREAHELSTGALRFVALLCP